LQDLLFSCRTQHVAGAELAMASNYGRTGSSLGSDCMFHVVQDHNRQTWNMVVEKEGCNSQEWVALHLNKALIHMYAGGVPIKREAPSCPHAAGLMLACLDSAPNAVKPEKALCSNQPQSKFRPWALYNT
jgi:hypothetical protein